MPSTPTRSLAAFSSDQAPGGDVTLCSIRVSATRSGDLRRTLTREDESNYQRQLPAYRYSQGRQCSD